MFSDRDIIEFQKHHKIFDPFNEDQVQPASYDLILGDSFVEYPSWRELVDPKDAGTQWMEPRFASRFLPFRLEKDDFVLATTEEWISIPITLSGRMDGKSSVARMGIIVHAAGFFDPGFKGQGTLEIHNISGRAVNLWPGMRIAQMTLTKLNSLPLNAYRGKYQNQQGATQSRMAQDFRENQ